jgi:hypothetical protein
MEADQLQQLGKLTYAVAHLEQRIDRLEALLIEISKQVTALVQSRAVDDAKSDQISKIAGLLKWATVLGASIAGGFGGHKISRFFE